MTCIEELTDRHTNTQTYKPSDEHTCQNWKFWQVMMHDYVIMEQSKQFRIRILPMFLFNYNSSDQIRLKDYNPEHTSDLELTNTWNSMRQGELSDAFCEYFRENLHDHSKNKVVKWTTLGLSNWCQKRTPQSRPKLVIWMSRRMTTLMLSQKQLESRQMTTFLLVSLSYGDLIIALERLNDKHQIVKWWSCD